MKNINNNQLYCKYRREVTLMKNILVLFILTNSSISALPHSSEIGGNNISQYDQVESNQQNDKTITGKIIDEVGLPLTGVIVRVEGSQQGTISDIDGNYSIKVTEDQTLVFSFVGYLQKEIKVENQTVINIKMQEDTQLLEEVVVVGYGVQRKSDVVGPISAVTADEILSTPSFNALEGLKGKAAGVTIFNNTGNPLGNDESSARVVIRGMNSINTSTDPLYVVDGVQMNEIQYLNPNDIERMEVLKDASATAIYGARGANGVILITTKRGATGRQGVVVSYDGWMNVSTLANKVDVMNSSEFMQMQDIAFANISKYDQGRRFLEGQGITELLVDRSDPLIFDANGNPLYDTDWQEEATRNAISHSHQLSVQQQTDKSSFGAFFNYTDCI